MPEGQPSPRYRSVAERLRQCAERSLFPEVRLPLTVLAASFERLAEARDSASFRESEDTAAKPKKPGS
ncbi:MAG TPA: hypothetical protein VMB84_04030 [Stellaceae bacterium]|nr:hypothetical protein [Stellaceae bacterium]